MGHKCLKVQASVARCLRTPPYAARRKGLSFGLATAYAATATGARLSFAIVLFSPVTVADSRDKANPFRRSSILFRPPEPEHILKRRTPQWCFGGAAGYRPRVRSAYYERVYVHSPRRDLTYILARQPLGKRAWVLLFEIRLKTVKRLKALSGLPFFPRVGHVFA